MNRHWHWLQAALCVVLLLCVFASSAYIVHEAAHPHECAGEDCPVCQLISQVEQLRRGFGMALLALLLICFALAVGHEWRTRAMAEDVPALCTLVGRKVRLND